MFLSRSFKNHFKALKLLGLIYNFDFVLTKFKLRHL